MEIFFVRHGQTSYNQLGLYQHSEVELSQMGKNQAKRIAQRLKDYSFTHGYCSDYFRAKQTAEYINEFNPVEFKYTFLLREWTKPSEFHSKPYDDPRIAQEKEELHQKRLEDEYHQFSDEDSFATFKGRIKSMQQKLEKHEPEDSILCVSHGGFIINFLSYIRTKAQNKKYAYNDCLFNKKFYSLSNTSITVLSYTKEEKWKLITWNDYAHL